MSRACLRFITALFSRHDESLHCLEALAGQAAITIESTTLFTDLQLAHDDLSQAYDSTIEGWSRALDLRDRETEGHTQRVAEVRFNGAPVGLGDAEIRHIRWGALLHDIGKMGVPDLFCSSPIHSPTKSGRLCGSIPFRVRFAVSHHYLRSALDIPYCHHEKWDGSGYPRGLIGEQIPFAARLFAVVDVWDALCSDRPYRKSSPRKKWSSISGQMPEHILTQK